MNKNKKNYAEILSPDYLMVCATELSNLIHAAYISRANGFYVPNGIVESALSNLIITVTNDGIDIHFPSEAWRVNSDMFTKNNHTSFVPWLLDSGWAVKKEGARKYISGRIKNKSVAAKMLSYKGNKFITDTIKAYKLTHPELEIGMIVEGIKVI